MCKLKNFIKIRLDKKEEMFTILKINKKKIKEV